MEKQKSKQKTELSRYNLSSVYKNGNADVLMIKSTGGSFVAYDDYKKLLEENERLKKAGDNVVATYVSRTFINDQVIREWRSAKV
jgi:hypothetical protein